MDSRLGLARVALALRKQPRREKEEARVVLDNRAEPATQSQKILEQAALVVAHRVGWSGVRSKRCYAMRRLSWGLTNEWRLHQIARWPGAGAREGGFVSLGRFSYSNSGRCRGGTPQEKTRRLFGRSLKLRQVSAGGCNACEADLNVLGTIVFDLARFGIQFVASPRHADGIVITGPVSENMRAALLETYAAVPAPKLVIAVGACAISGGPFVDNPEVHNGCASLLPVDLFIPGCPPHPMTVLDGLLRLLDRQPAST
jgi:Ni,Fe-hydrogenase III small subunit